MYIIEYVCAWGYRGKVRLLITALRIAPIKMIITRLGSYLYLDIFTFYVITTLHTAHKNRLVPINLDFSNNIQSTNRKARANILEIFTRNSLLCTPVSSVDVSAEWFERVEERELCCRRIEKSCDLEYCNFCLSIINWLSPFNIRRYFPVVYQWINPIIRSLNVQMLY